MVEILEICTTTEVIVDTGAGDEAVGGFVEGTSITKVDITGVVIETGTTSIVDITSEKVTTSAGMQIIEDTTNGVTVKGTRIVGGILEQITVMMTSKDIWGRMGTETGTEMGAMTEGTG